MLVRKVPWGSQPQDIVGINKSSPLAAGLGLAFNAANRGYDESGGRRATIGSGGVTWGAGQFGQRVRGVSVNEGNLRFANMPVSTAYTVMAVVHDHTQGANRQFFDADGNIARTFQFHLDSSNHLEFIPFNTGGSPFFATSTATVDSQSLQVLVGTVDVNQLASVYINGKQNGTTSTITGSVQTLASQYVAIGNSAHIVVNNPFLGDFYAAFFWNRALSPTEILELSKNPWQLFEPQSITLPHYFATGQRIHYVVYPASESRYPQAQDVIDGWPGVATTTGYEANSSSSLVNFYVDAEGLADGTSYKLAYVWYDGNNVSDVVISDSFSTLSGAIALTAGNDTQVSTSATGVITQVQVLTVGSDTQDSSSGTGSIASPINLTVSSDTQDSTSATVAVTQIHIISVGSDTQNNSTTTASISQDYAITAANTSQANTSSTDVITQVQVLVAANSTQDSTSASASITLAQVLTSGSDTQDSTSATAVITQVHIVSVGSDSQANTSATAVITQTQILTVANSTQGNTSSTGVVGGDGTLSVAPCSQANTSASVSITQTQVLTVGSDTQADSDNISAVTQIHVITVANCSDSSTSGTGTVSVGSGVSADNCSQSASSSTAVITQVHILVGSNCNSTNNSSTDSITQAGVFIGANCSQVHTSEAVALTQIYNTILGSSCDTTSSSSTGTIDIINILIAANSSQSNISLEEAVTQVHILLAANASQGNNSSPGSLATSFYVPGTVVAQNEPKRLFISGTRAGVTVTVVNPNRFIRATG